MSKTHVAPGRLGGFVNGRLAAGLVALGLLGACAAPPPAPDDQFYRLDLVASNPGPTVLDGVIEVDRFVASGALANRPLLFSQPGSNAVSEYHYHFWMEPPPILLQSALVSYLRSDNVATRVVTPEMRTTPNYSIMGRILRMEVVRGANPVGAVTFELTLRRESDDKLLVLGEYRSEMPAGANGMQTDVAAIELAAKEAFANFVADIRAIKP
ncbi:MAG TPA: ABC-type transport auxiliary lipoprotein family protein [Magnetovibrio sp.]